MVSAPRSVSGDRQRQRAAAAHWQPPRGEQEGAAARRQEQEDRNGIQRQVADEDQRRAGGRHDISDQEYQARLAPSVALVTGVVDRKAEDEREGSAEARAGDHDPYRGEIRAESKTPAARP